MAHVPHVLVPGPWQATIPLDDGQARHLTRVLRLGDDAPISYTDGAGTVGEGRLRRGEIQRGDESTVARPTHLILAVAPPSSKDRQRFVVEKASELGVARLEWVRTAFGEGNAPSPAKATAWAASGLEQSRGAWLMELSTASLADVLANPTLVVADAAGTQLPISPAPGVVLVGPEGGFAPGEIPDGARRLSLGATVLRVETAAVVAVALLTRR